MNDPFAEGQDQPSAASRLFAKFRESVTGSGEDPSTPTQRNEFPSVSGGHATDHISSHNRGAHPRTVSEDIEDHMGGSVHQGIDLCPSCGYTRMSSVYCPVSQLHHGTDLPSETPRRKKQSIFSRLRDSMSGLTPLGGGDESNHQSEAGDSALPTEHAESGDIVTNGAGADVSATASPSHGISGLFTKTKEEKQISELMHLEEKSRKQIVEVVKLSAHEIDRQLTSVHKEFREVLRAHERARNVILFDFKTEFDKFYADRKKELEDLKKEFVVETKLLLKKEKERRKHASDADASVSSPTTEEASGTHQEEESAEAAPRDASNEGNDG